MWARKAKKQCRDEDSGIMSEIEYIHLEESWYEILLEGCVGFFIMLLLMCICLVVTPCLAIRAAYRQIRYSDAVVPQNEVRERAYFG